MTLFWLALRSNPSGAIRALLALARGYKVRGRRLLREAAAANPRYYGYWSKSVSPQLVASWCGARPQVSTLAARQALLVLGDSDRRVEATVRDFCAALPGALVVPFLDDLAGALSFAQDNGHEWLIVPREGDRCVPGLAAVLNRVPAIVAHDVIFWDHDVIADGLTAEPAIKPDWDPVLARNFDLLGNAASIRISAALAELADWPATPVSAAAVGRLQSTLAARVCPLHIPLVLTHSSKADGYLAPDDQRALFGLPQVKTQWPGVSIIVPTRDQAGLLEDCLSGLERLTYAGPIETIVVDNDSVEPETHALFARFQHRRNTRVIPWPGAFNFAAMMNFAATQVRNPFLCFLNNDVEPLDGDWLQTMMVEGRVSDVGAVGARLLYPDGTIQHVGVTIGLGGAAGHIQKGVVPQEGLFWNWHGVTRRVSAVTAACLLVEKAKFEAVGGMNSEVFAVDFNDVDFCLKLDRAGWRNLVVPDATLIHHESKSRGRQRRGNDLRRFERELASLKHRWGTETYEDPWHSPLFLKESERCVLRI